MGFRIADEEPEQLPEGYQLADPTEEDPMKLESVTGRPGIFRPQGAPGTEPPSPTPNKFATPPEVPAEAYRYGVAPRDVNTFARAYPYVKPTVEWLPPAAVAARTGGSPHAFALTYGISKGLADYMDPRIPAETQPVNAFVKGAKDVGTGYLGDITSKVFAGLGPIKDAFGRAVPKVASTKEPLSEVMAERGVVGVAGRGLRTGGTWLVGKLTGLGTANVDEAIRAAKSTGTDMFRKAMRRELSRDEIIGNFQAAFQKLKDLRLQELTERLAEIERGPAIPIKPKAPPPAPEKVAANLKLELGKETPGGGRLARDTRPKGVGEFEIRPGETIPDAYRRAQVGAQLKSRPAEKAALEAEAAALQAEVKAAKTGRFRYEKTVERLEKQIKATKDPSTKDVLRDELREVKETEKLAQERARRLLKVQGDLTKFETQTKRLQNQYDKPPKPQPAIEPPEQKYAGMKALNLTSAKDEVAKGLDELFPRKTAEGKNIFERPTFETVGNRDTDIVMDITDRVNSWGKVPGDRTIKGVDELIRNLERHVPKTRQVQQFQERVVGKLREIAYKEVPEYGVMRQRYDQALQFEDDLAKVLSLGKGNPDSIVAADTILRKVLRAMKEDEGIKRDLIRAMSDKTGDELIEQAAGYAFSSITPSAARSRLFPTVEQEAGVLGSLFRVISYKWLALAAMGSPRLAGEFLLFVSKAITGPVSRTYAPTVGHMATGAIYHKEPKQTGVQQYIEARDAIRNYPGWSEEQKSEMLKKLEERARQQGDIR